MLNNTNGLWFIINKRHLLHHCIGMTHEIIYEHGFHSADAHKPVSTTRLSNKLDSPLSRLGKDI